MQKTKNQRFSTQCWSPPLCILRLWNLSIIRSEQTLQGSHGRTTVSVPPVPTVLHASVCIEETPAPPSQQPTVEVPLVPPGLHRLIHIGLSLAHSLGWSAIPVPFMPWNIWVPGLPRKTLVWAWAPVTLSIQVLLTELFFFLDSFNCLLQNSVAEFTLEKERH